MTMRSLIFATLAACCYTPTAGAQLIQDYQVNSQISATSYIACWPILSCQRPFQRWETDTVTNNPGTASALLEGPDAVRGFATASADWSVDSDGDSAVITAEVSAYHEALSNRNPPSNSVVRPAPSFGVTTVAGILYEAGFTLMEDAYFQFDAIAEQFYFGASDAETPTQVTGDTVFYHNYTMIDGVERSVTETGFLPAGRYAFMWRARTEDIAGNLSSDMLYDQVDAALSMRFNRAPFDHGGQVPELNAAGSGMVLGLLVAMGLIRRERAALGHRKPERLA